MAALAGDSFFVVPPSGVFASDLAWASNGCLLATACRRGRSIPAGHRRTTATVFGIRDLFYQSVILVAFTAWAKGARFHRECASWLVFPGPPAEQNAHVLPASGQVLSQDLFQFEWQVDCHGISSLPVRRP